MNVIDLPRILFKFVDLSVIPSKLFTGHKQQQNKTKTQHWIYQHTPESVAFKREYPTRNLKSLEESSKWEGEANTLPV